MWTGTEQRVTRNYGNYCIVSKMAASSKVRQLLMGIAAHAKTTKTFDRVAKEVNTSVKLILLKNIATI